MSDSIADIVNGVVDGSLSDEGVIDWLMDIFENGLDENSTIFLTKAMRDSGKVLAWPKKIGAISLLISTQRAELEIRSLSF